VSCQAFKTSCLFLLQNQEGHMQRGHFAQGKPLLVSMKLWSHAPVQKPGSWQTTEITMTYQDMSTFYLYEHLLLGSWDLTLQREMWLFFSLYQKTLSRALWSIIFDNESLKCLKVIMGGKRRWLTSSLKQLSSNSGEHFDCSSADNED
jgi:hypothetical protein